MTHYLVYIKGKIAPAVFMLPFMRHGLGYGFDVMGMGRSGS